jgi:hypothetical protein
VDAVVEEWSGRVGEGKPAEGVNGVVVVAVGVVTDCEPIRTWLDMDMMGRIGI